MCTPELLTQFLADGSDVFMMDSSWKDKTELGAAFTIIGSVNSTTGQGYPVAAVLSGRADTETYTDICTQFKLAVKRLAQELAESGTPYYQ